MQVLRKRRWVFFAAIAVGILFGFYRSRTQPVLFTASGGIEVRSGSSNEYRVSAAAYSGGDNRLGTEVAIIQSDSLLSTVAREMNLANKPAFYGVRGTLPRRDMNDPAVRQEVVASLRGNLTVALTPRTDIIRISYVSPDAQLSADIVNHLINAYIQRSFETRFASTQRVSQWLSSQLDDLKQQVETAQEQLIDLQKRLGVLGLGFDATRPLITQNTASVDALTTASSNARIARILAESRYRTLREADPSTFADTAENTPGVAAGELARIRADIASTKAALAQESVLLGPKNPRVLGIEAHLHEAEHSLETEQSRLLAQARADYTVAKANEDQTTGALDKQKNDAYALRDELVEYTLRQREYDSSRSLYESLLSRLRAAGVQAGLESLEIDVVDQAARPATPTMTPQSTIVLQCAAFGLLGGIVLAFLLESLDTGLRSIAEIESVTQLPSLAVIPRTRRIGPEANTALTVAQSNIGVLATTKSQFAESFRSLRTSMLLATTGHPPKIILISSATPAEGKTTIATNLACILAQRDTRVVLIDGDMRRPNVHHRFGLSGRVGLSTVLAGAASLTEAVRSVPEVPNLDVLCSGPVPPFPTEMLSSESMHQLLEECALRYTHIVIDSPPILSVTDGVILARQADAMALVVRHGKSSRSVVRRACDLLMRSGAPITGIVLNAVDLNSPEYYGYYGYSAYSYSNIDSETWDSPERERVTVSQGAE